MVSIMATQQKLKLLAQLNGFSLSKAKCFAESDRPLVEGAIAEWFGYRGQGVPCGSDVKAECLVKFEECVREGEVFAKFMDKISDQGSRETTTHSVKSRIAAKNYRPYGKSTHLSVLNFTLGLRTR